MSTIPFLPDSDDAYEGNPPTSAELAHEEEVGLLIHEFEKISRPGVFVAFELRNAVGAYCGRRSKLPLHTEDGARLKRAVGAALRTALRNPDTRRMRFLRRGMAAICEAIDAWVNPSPLEDQPRYVRNAYVGLLKHETAIADIASAVSRYEPTSWSRKHRADLGPLFD